ncbi:MAG: Ig domain protein group 2 domain protein [Gemmatimonadetes bacterium]|nr:Ig domain protein group 2 domain protein [Gemmatimonadota bacterium]
MARIRRASALVGVLGALAGCGSSTTPTPTCSTISCPEVGSITIAGPSPLIIEKSYHTTLTATAKNKSGVTITVPFVWRSLDEKVATVDANGRITAIDTGTTVIVATSLGVNSTPVGVAVVLHQAVKIDTVAFKAPNAITPGATPDSVRVRVTNIAGGSVVGARVKFAVTAGGGTISPAIATTDAGGIASAEWKLGPANGVNTATAVVLGEDDVVNPNVKANLASYSITTYAAIKSQDGDGQQGLILSTLPINPSIKLVDSLGKPRPGIPVTFSATGGGRVALGIVPTDANGFASPGAWTLGDVNGQQTLIAKVEFATLALKAVATGTAVHYSALQVVAGGNATCALTVDNQASCWGQEPLVGDSTLSNKSTPTVTKGAHTFFSLAASPSNTGHFCGIGTEQAVYCWGNNALTDTNAANPVLSTRVPTRMPTDLTFSKVAPGNSHNCALGIDQNAYCWGDDAQGQLGDFKTVVRLTPAIVGGSFKFTDISSGFEHTCALALGGSAYCWGRNSNGQFGNGTTSGSSAPVIVQTPVSFQRIGAGSSFSCGLTTTGAVLCWGNLGTGNTAVLTPRAYPNAPVFTSMSVGGFHVCALTADGTPYCWGNNQIGQLGDSTVVEKLVPTAVATPLKFKSISAGYAHTCGVVQDGAVACWGDNGFGQLGDSTAAVKTIPKYIILSVTP